MKKETVPWTDSMPCTCSCAWWRPAASPRSRMNSPPPSPQSPSRSQPWKRASSGRAVLREMQDHRQRRGRGGQGSPGAPDPGAGPAAHWQLGGLWPARADTAGAGIHGAQPPGADRPELRGPLHRPGGQRHRRGPAPGQAGRLQPGRTHAGREPLGAGGLAHLPAQARHAAPPLGPQGTCHADLQQRAGQRHLAPAQRQRRAGLGGGHGPAALQQPFGPAGGLTLAHGHRRPAPLRGPRLPGSRPRGRSPQDLPPARAGNPRRLPLAAPGAAEGAVLHRLPARQVRNTRGGRRYPARNVRDPPGRCFPSAANDNAAPVSGANGGNLSPQLSWSGHQRNRRFANLALSTQMQPTGSGWWHWQMVAISEKCQTSCLPVAGDAPEQKGPAGSISTRNELWHPRIWRSTCPPNGHGRPPSTSSPCMPLSKKLEIPDGWPPGDLTGYMVARQLDCIQHDRSDLQRETDLASPRQAGAVYGAWIEKFWIMLHIQKIAYLRIEGIPGFRHIPGNA
ncbi:hypothetical protein FQR65_LT20121 [Abscondita terminalis]|nr:hypothetical protein FQR65_LT20121 [Abscondita terminalis]